jgi:hypothetical protein
MVRIRKDFYFWDLAADLLPHLSSKFLAVVYIPANMVPVQLVPVLELLSTYCWVRYGTHYSVTDIYCSRYIAFREGTVWYCMYMFIAHYLF